MKLLVVVSMCLTMGSLAGPAGAVGTISGTVRADPRPADGPPVKIAKDPSICGQEAARDRLVMAADGALANVVVSLKPGKAPHPPVPTANAVVDQVGCRYAPHVLAVTVGTTVSLLNNDAVLHNVHAVSEGGATPSTVFNVAMPFKGEKLPTVMRRPGTLRLRCDAGHTWMSAYIHVFEHPFFAVTDDKGRFTIKDVPPGRYTLSYWHEPLDDKKPAVVKTTTIDVAGGKETIADATLGL
jgi:plastocyanin